MNILIITVIISGSSSARGIGGWTGSDGELSYFLLLSKRFLTGAFFITMLYYWSDRLLHEIHFIVSTVKVDFQLGILVTAEVSGGHFNPTIRSRKQ